MKRPPQPGRQGGSIMIEILITIVISVIGLWGLTVVQSRLQMSEIESYQRAQALMLLNDIAARLQINRAAASSYVTTSALGAGMTCPTTTSTMVQKDKGEWCGALQGAAEAIGTSKVGAMVGARGCVESIGTNEYMITVAWQGMTPASAPPASVSCGENAYDQADSPCVDDLCRRVVTTVVRIGNLTP